MAFKTDNQTLTDLGIFASRAEESIYWIYNRCCTNGGLKVLEQMFQAPLSDATLINDRAKSIAFFQDNNIKFPFDSTLFSPTELYLNNRDERTRLAHEYNNMRRKLSGVIGAENEFNDILKGITSTISIINSAVEFIEQYKYDKSASCVMSCFSELSDTVINTAIHYKGKNKISYNNCVELDSLLRFKHNRELRGLLNSIYYIDVYSSVAEVSKKRGFTFAQVINNQEGYIKLEGVYHPRFEQGVGNDILIDKSKNMIFLTGANMAGKSTIMKSIAISVYIAHIGFPVAASLMEFSVRSGMFTTINLPDNINVGYSHFYSEVMRLKKIAQEVKQNSNVVIIFDELFRGTNVKDAYDATVEIVESFSRVRRCSFIVSTHIIEAGEVIKQRCSNVQFIYMPTTMNGSVPQYSYKAKQGITSDRHGMVIINNEKVVEIIEEAFKI